MVKEQPEETKEQVKTPEKEKLQPQGVASMRASDAKKDGKSGDAQYAEAKNIDPNSKELLDSAFDKNEVKYYKGLGLKEAEV
ncbi:MAG: hypothetical protein MUC85_05445, partial [Anaerolineales bacterium]|nr:hypothetical protein [Anaerolineales bacterium]